MWTLPKRKCWKTEELCLEKTEAWSANTKPCTKKTVSAIGCGRMSEVKMKNRTTQTGKQKKKKVKKLEKRGFWTQENNLTESFV